MERRNEDASPVPQELLTRSRVTRYLWNFRGRYEGTSMTTLCAQTMRSNVAITAQVRAARKYLRRVGSAWEILSEERETEEGSLETYFWLVAPHCPRPARREVPELHEPELIAWEDVPEDFPILPRWD